jgi:hypothetical protein
MPNSDPAATELAQLLGSGTAPRFRTGSCFPALLKPFHGNLPAAAALMGKARLDVLAFRGFPPELWRQI